MKKLPVHLGISFVVAFLSLQCSSTKSFSSRPDCSNLTYPKTVAGMHVAGGRPAGNVIRNMEQIICLWRMKCLQENRSDLTGTIILRLTVNHAGELGVLGMEHDMADSAFINHLVEGLYALDFDPWNDDQTPTEIVYPVRLFLAIGRGQQRSR